MNNGTAWDQLPTLDSVILPELGEVSLVPIDRLRQARDAERSAANRLSGQAATLVRVAEEKLADAGAILVPQRGLWPVPPKLYASIQRADELVSQMAAMDRRWRDPRQHFRGGLVSQVSAWLQYHRRNRASEELRSILIEVARRALGAGAGSPDARPLLEQAGSMEADAAEAHRTREVCSGREAALNQEISRREESQRHMGFDALYTAACLQRYGPQPVSSPLQLESGEITVLAVPCTLAQTMWTRHVGRQSRFGFPIDHTGIRYRVGSYRGQSLEQQVLRHLDTGTLVVSNQRLAFIGRVKSVVIQLPTVAHLDIYNDALAVFQEGLETPYFLLLSAPKQVAFYLNWGLQ